MKAARQIDGVINEDELKRDATVSKMEIVQQVSNREVTRKNTQALATDEADLKQLEEIEKKLLENREKLDE